MTVFTARCWLYCLHHRVFDEAQHTMGQQHCVGELSLTLYAFSACCVCDGVRPSHLRSWKWECAWTCAGGLSTTLYSTAWNKEQVVWVSALDRGGLTWGVWNVQAIWVVLVPLCMWVARGVRASACSAVQGHNGDPAIRLCHLGVHPGLPGPAVQGDWPPECLLPSAHSIQLHHKGEPPQPDTCRLASCPLRRHRTPHRDWLQAS